MSTLPPTNHHAYIPNISADETFAIDFEIKKLLSQKVITPCEDEQDEFVSPIFTTTNHDGGLRLILNLKQLNKHVVHGHFKMDHPETCHTKLLHGVSRPKERILLCKNV